MEQVHSATPGTTPDANQAAGPTANRAQPTHNLPQLVASAQDKVKQATADLTALEQQAASISGKKRQTVDDQIAEEKSELELAEARLEALQNMNAFATAGASVGLPGKVDELQRTVPEVRVTRSVESSVRPLHSESTRAGNLTDSPGAGSGSASSNNNGGSASGGNSAVASNAAESGASSAPSAALGPFSLLPLSAPPAAVAPSKQPSCDRERTPTAPGWRRAHQYQAGGRHPQRQPQQACAPRRKLNHLI